MAGIPNSSADTKILLDGGDPDETARIKNLLGFLEGQTTNPTFVAKNPEVQTRIASGHKLSQKGQELEYKKIVQGISSLVGDAGVSIEVYADFDTKAEQMLAQAKEMYSWIPNAYIKYPCLPEGVRAAQMSVEKNIRVNMTLCFSQEQAAAVYAATKGARSPVYVSPFVGRLDDRGDDGMGLVRNIKTMYSRGDGHVHVLTASLRRLDHLLCAVALRSELVTAPAKILEEWSAKRFPMPDASFEYNAKDSEGKPLAPIPYRNLDLGARWETFNLGHELTDKGIERFVSDYRSTLAPVAA